MQDTKTNSFRKQSNFDESHAQDLNTRAGKWSGCLQ